MNTKWILAIALFLAGLPALAQVNPGLEKVPLSPAAQKRINEQVQTALLRVQNQAVSHKQANPTLGAQAEHAATPKTATQPQQKCTCEQEPLSTQELIDAEEELALIRSRKDNHATFDKYPYLLDPQYRRRQVVCPCTRGSALVSTQKPVTQEKAEPLEPFELIEAEEELALIRNRQDLHATFDKYPYLLDPQYRRATKQQQQSIRRQYTQQTWARKVGL